MRDFSSFRFSDEVREHVQSLGALIVFANKQKSAAWAAQSDEQSRDGVYGYATKALEKIIRIETDDEIVRRIQHSRDGWNWGGNWSEADDVEVAIHEAYLDWKEEQEWEELDDENSELARD